MAENKTITQENPLVSITGAELFRVAFGGFNFKVSFNQFLTWLTSGVENITSATLAFGLTDEPIVLGNSDNYDGFTLDYVALRGSRRRKGIIQVVHDGTNCGVTETGMNTLPNDLIEDCGLTFSANVVSGICNLLVTTDSSDSSGTTIKYMLTKY